MPRKNCKHDPSIPYHISARSINREWFLSIGEVWSVMEDYLCFLTHAFNVKIYAFVLMNNHYHLIANFPDNNMSQAMLYFMRETSKRISKTADRINQTYGSRYFKSGLKTYHYYLHAYKYIYRNPIDARLELFVQNYRYSTLNGLLGLSHLYIPIIEDSLLFDHINETLNWLNQKPKLDHKAAIQKALKKPFFEIPRDRKTRKLHDLEFNTY